MMITACHIDQCLSAGFNIISLSTLFRVFLFDGAEPTVADRTLTISCQIDQAHFIRGMWRGVRTGTRSLKEVMSIS